MRESILIDVEEIKFYKQIGLIAMGLLLTTLVILYFTL